VVVKKINMKNFGIYNSGPKFAPDSQSPKNTTLKSFSGEKSTY
jgi:hypothetical protein